MSLFCFLPICNDFFKDTIWELLSLINEQAINRKVLVFVFTDYLGSLLPKCNKRDTV